MQQTSYTMCCILACAHAWPDAGVPAGKPPNPRSPRAIFGYTNICKKRMRIQLAAQKIYNALNFPESGRQFKTSKIKLAALGWHTRCSRVVLHGCLSFSHYLCLFVFVSSFGFACVCVCVCAHTSVFMYLLTVSCMCV